MNESDRQGYVIITPAYNESEHIELAIQSVRAQSKQPVRWVIVDDGSTDDTASIIRNYAAQYPFIRYHRRVRIEGQAYYSSNVAAITEGYRVLKGCEFNYVAILDSDIMLPEDYYESILRYFSQVDKLGIASGIYENLINGKLRRVLNDRRSTPKAIMVFRRDVFEQIGGFLPLPYGGEDTIACVMARMKGWKTWSFPDVKVVHLRPTGTGNAGNVLLARFEQGVCEYNLAMHPLFFLVKSFRRCIKESPYIAGGVARILGFICASFRRERRQMTEELVKYIRKEQLGRVFKGNSIPTEFQVSTSCRS